MPNNKITAFGQKIVDTICDRLAKEGEEYSLKMIGKTHSAVSYCAAKLGRPVRSVAGGISDLIEKSYVCNEWYVDSDARTNDMSLTQTAWLSWSQHSEGRIQTILGMSSDDFAVNDEPPDRLEKDIWNTHTQNVS